MNFNSHYHSPVMFAATLELCSGIGRDQHRFRMFGKWQERCIKCGLEHPALTTWRANGYAGPHPFLVLLETSDTKPAKPYWSEGDYAKYMAAQNAKRIKRGTKKMRATYLESRELVATADAPEKALRHAKVLALAVQRKAKKAAQKASSDKVNGLIEQAKEKIADKLLAHEAVTLTKLALSIIKMEGKTERELRREAAMDLFK